MPLRGQDLSNTLTMLHATLMQTGTNLQDTLNKGIEKIEVGGRAIQHETKESVVAELNRMRTDLRDTRNRLAASREELSADVHQAITLLRHDVQKITATLKGRSAVGTEAADPFPAAPEGSGADGSAITALALVDEALRPAPADSASSSALAGPPAAAPARLNAGAGTDDAPAVEEHIREAVRAALADEIADLRSLLTSFQEARVQQAATYSEHRQQLDQVGKELTALAVGIEDWKTQHAAEHNPAEPEVTKEHSALLQQAARVASAVLVCHRDMWDFVTGHAGRHPHFRVPPKITDHGNEYVSAAISGRSLIAVLISLYGITHTATEGDGDWEMATMLYQRIHHRLIALAPGGEPVTIALDDRFDPNSHGTDDVGTASTSDAVPDEDSEGGEGDAPPSPAA